MVKPSRESLDKDGLPADTRPDIRGPMAESIRIDGRAIEQFPLGLIYAEIAKIVENAIQGTPLMGVDETDAENQPQRAKSNSKLELIIEQRDYGRQVVGQSFPAAATETSIYVVPADMEFEGSLTWCNVKGVADSVRAFIVPGGGAATAVNAIEFDVPLSATSKTLTREGIRMGEGDQMWVYSANGNTAFTLMGREMPSI